MSTVLITGAAGFIGSHLGERLINEGHRVIALDNFNDYYSPNIKRKNISALLKSDNFELVEDDILNIDGLKKHFLRNKVDILVHLAARAGVRPSIQQPLLYQKVNVEGTNNLLEIARDFEIEKFIFASSSSVYGENKKLPFSEDDFVDHPISPYASTKKAGELICYTYHHLYQLPVTCLRFFTVYGPRQRPDMAICKFTRNISQGKKITMFGNGESRRDYTYVSDIVDGVCKAIENCNKYHIYNLGESTTIELSRLIEVISKCLGKEPIIERLPNQPGDVPITYADITRAREEIGYSPKVNVEEGVKKFTAWYVEQAASS